jgi:hypothetical protein
MRWCNNIVSGITRINGDGTSITASIPTYGESTGRGGKEIFGVSAASHSSSLSFSVLAIVITTIISSIIIR